MPRQSLVEMRTATPDAVLDVLYNEVAAAAPKLRLMAAWPTSKFCEWGETPQSLDTILYHPWVPAALRERLRQSTQAYGPSLLAQMAVRDPPPFTFTEATQAVQPSARDRWVIDLLQEHGIRDGLYSPQGSWMVVFAADRVLTRAVLSRPDRVSIDIGANLAVYRLKEIMARAQAAEASTLSRREIAALRHLAGGETTASISARMGVTKNSVQTYLKRAQKKLNARSQLHAVAVALRKRII